MVSKEQVLKDAAVHWMKNMNTTGEEPEFSTIKGTGIFFNDNKAADELNEYLITAGEDAGHYMVSPADVVFAAYEAEQHIKAMSN